MHTLSVESPESDEHVTIIQMTDVVISGPRNAQISQSNSLLLPAKSPDKKVE